MEREDKHAILQVTEEIFMIHGPKIPLTEIRKKVLQNAVKYMQDLMEIFQDVVGKSAESRRQSRRQRLYTIKVNPLYWRGIQRKGRNRH